MMVDILKNILENPTMLGREGQYIVVDELARQTEPTVILARLPLVERIRLYASLANPQNPYTKDIDPETYYAIVSTVGNSIDPKQKDMIEASALVAIGRQQLREKKDIPEDNSNEFDGFQDVTERSRQLYLAYVVSAFLPGAVKETPARFVTTRLSETEQGTILALLMVRRAETDANVQTAMNVLFENIKLTPTLWNSFQSTCAELDKNPSHLADKALTLVDSIVEREIRRLSPGDIAKLEDQQAYRYLQALGWGGTVTPLFRATQLYFYQNLNPSNAIQELREQQIDSAVEHFSHLTEEQLEEWQKTKDGWTGKSTSDKNQVLTNYVSSFGDLIGIPKKPEVSVVSWGEAPDKPRSLSNGYFLGWQTTKIDDKLQKVFGNKIILIDDVDEYGGPLSVSRSLRSALSTSTHEALHSDDEQKISRFSTSKYSNYAASFAEGTSPSELQPNDPLGYTAGALFWTSIGRTSYVSPETNQELYRHQPFEKYAWSFQNQFTAALNGTLISHQIEIGDRDLREELKSLFKKVGQVLVARNDLTSDATDIVPLKNYERSAHPFGALTMMDGEAIEKGIPTENNDRNYIAVDFSKFNGRTEVLTYLQDSLEKLQTRSTANLDDYTSLFKQSADFLIQMPSEIWAIKKKLGTESPELSDKLDGLAIKAQILGEDLSDYSFMVGRKKEIEIRKTEEKAQRAKLQKIASSLAATL